MPPRLSDHWWAPLGQHAVPSSDDSGSDWALDERPSSRRSWLVASAVGGVFTIASIITLAAMKAHTSGGIIEANFDGMITATASDSHIGAGSFLQMGGIGVLQPAAPLRSTLACRSVTTCSGVGSTCTPREQACWTAVQAAGENIGLYNIFNYSEAWLPAHVSDLTDRNIQMVLHMYDLSGACPMPCADAPTTSNPAPPATVAATCPPQAPKPMPPAVALDYNGISWPSMCFEGDEEEHVLLIGDWGGWKPGEPADNTGRLINHPTRQFVGGVDDKAQFLVAQAVRQWAEQAKPRYVLNVGDNFYWGGCNEYCSTRSIAESIQVFHSTHKDNVDKFQHNCSRQFYAIFETMYMGPGLDGKPWISVLGNHDYGGFHFHAAWDQQIAYTWGPGGRWILPGLYYHQHVDYATRGFSVDYYMLDTNVADVQGPDVNGNEHINHNMCNTIHMGPKSDCRPFGPWDVPSCVSWFTELWEKQVPWLETKLTQSTADWQIIVTHFPPETRVANPKFVADLKRLGKAYGIDLVISGHRHVQAQYPTGVNDVDAAIGTAGIPYVVTGGGGGITSESAPDGSSVGTGHSEYGFMDMVLTKNEIRIDSLDHAGAKVKSITVYPRAAATPTTSLGPTALAALGVVAPAMSSTGMAVPGVAAPGVAALGVVATPPVAFAPAVPAPVKTAPLLAMPPAVS